MSERIKYYEVVKLTSKKGNKYNAKKTEYNGHSYDSKHEARVAQYLDLLLKEKDARDTVIKWIPHPKKFTFTVNGKKITSYTPDFMVKYSSGKVEYWDAKSEATRKAEAYRIRKKWLLAEYGIDVKEISKHDLPQIF